MLYRENEDVSNSSTGSHTRALGIFMITRLCSFIPSYYGPLKEMTDRGPVFCDVRDARARERHKAVSCPDKILTAFCQLGALRMGARRALVFFFDVNHAYIMAEATRTLSLEDDNTHDSGDQLWSTYLQRVVAAF